MLQLLFLCSQKAAFCMWALICKTLEVHVKEPFPARAVLLTSALAPECLCHGYCLVLILEMLNWLGAQPPVLWHDMAHGCRDANSHGWPCNFEFSRRSI